MLSLYFALNSKLYISSRINQDCHILVIFGFFFFLKNVSYTQLAPSLYRPTQSFQTKLWHSYTKITKSWRLLNEILVGYSWWLPATLQGATLWEAISLGDNLTGNPIKIHHYSWHLNHTPWKWQPRPNRSLQKTLT